MHHELAVKLAVGIITIISSLFGSFFFMDSRHAKASEVEALKIYTTYTVKELQLDAVIHKLEMLLAVPETERRPWQKREIVRLNLHVEVMQNKMVADQIKKDEGWFP